MADYGLTLGDGWIDVREGNTGTRFYIEKKKANEDIGLDTRYVVNAEVSFNEDSGAEIAIFDTKEEAERFMEELAKFVDEYCECFNVGYKYRGYSDKAKNYVFGGLRRKLAWKNIIAVDCGYEDGCHYVNEYEVGEVSKYLCVDMYGREVYEDDTIIRDDRDTGAIAQAEICTASMMERYEVVLPESPEE